MKRFRNLTEKEVQLRIASVNNGGVELLLWKAPLADLQVLDEKEVHYSLQYSPINNRFEGEKCYVNCSLSIDIDGDWRKLEGIGEGVNFKTASTDALHRAGVIAGIGRELYSVNKLFIPKEHLKSHEITGEKKSCYDTFKVIAIEYNDNDDIEFLGIQVSNFGEPHCVIEYDVVNGDAKIKAVHTATKKPDSSVKESPVEEDKEVPEANSETSKKEALSKTETPNETEGFAEDEVILFGLLKGEKYGNVKETPDFKKFVDWAKKNPTRQYSDAKVAAQFKKLLKM